MKRIKQLIVFVIIIMTCSIAFAINFNSLPFGYAFDSWVVEGDETQPIHFSTSERKLMYFCATTPCYVSSLKAKITVTAMGVTVPIPYPEDISYCVHNCTLPLKPGDVFWVQLSIALPSPFFTSGTFRVIFTNEDGVDIAGGECSFYVDDNLD